MPGIEIDARKRGGEYRTNGHGKRPIGRAGHCHAHREFFADRNLVARLDQFDKQIWRHGLLPKSNVRDFSRHGAVVTDKLAGTPLQSIIMKAALLPGYADEKSIGVVARRAGEWLRAFHKASSDMP